MKRIDASDVFIVLGETDVIDALRKKVCTVNTGPPFRLETA